MITRTLTGACLVAVLALVLTYSGNPIFLNTVIAVVSAASVFELYRAAGMLKYKWLYPVSCCLILVGAFLPSALWVTMVFFVAGVLCAFTMMHKVGVAHAVPAWQAGVMAACILEFFKTMSGIRVMDHGLLILIYAISVPVLNDVFAYLVGSRIGHHHLAPKLSPHKSIEGSVAGLSVGTLTLLLVAWRLDKTLYCRVDFVLLTCYLVSASVIGQFGDLAFSAVKRLAGVKDYGKLLPGHGGLLDRFDSALYTIPFTYIFFSLYPATISLAGVAG